MSNEKETITIRRRAEESDENWEGRKAILNWAYCKLIRLESEQAPGFVLRKASGDATMHFASDGRMYTTFRDDDGRVTWTNEPGVESDDGIDSMRIEEEGFVPGDPVCASIQGGTILIEREEMERVKALGVDIREVPENTRTFLIPRDDRTRQEFCDDANATLGARMVKSALAAREDVFNHFGLHEPALARQEIHGEWSPCPDCTKEPGVYVGLDSRKPCPTCQGGE